MNANYLDLDDSYSERYEEYTLNHDPNAREAYAANKPPRPQSQAERNQQRRDAIATLTESTRGLEDGFETTYQPARYEEGWLLSSLRQFYDESLISDVLMQVKGGKEASVYCCRAGLNARKLLGVELIAAKVYRPRQFRNLRNDAMYREGRMSLTAEGKARRRPESRVDRALKKKSSFGVEVAHTSWLMYEYATLEQLHEAGAAVPQPIAASDNAILMGYRGDVHQAASTLNEVALAPEEAPRLFDDALRNVELMLSRNMVHGDLSAYNILYWAGELTLIDFPQVVNVQGNSSARKIFARDVQRVCDYFMRQGVRCDPLALAQELWDEYVGESAAEWAAADFSRNE